MPPLQPLARPQGVHQGPSRLRRIVLKLDSVLDGTSPEKGVVQFPIPARGFRFELSSGVSRGQVFIAFGQPEQTASPAGFTAAAMRDALDALTCPAVYLQGGAPGPTTDLTVYTFVALAGETLTIYAFEDARFDPGASGANVVVTGTVTVAGTVAVSSLPATTTTALVNARGTAAMTDASATILAANANRRRLMLYNSGANPVAVRFAAAAADFATDVLIAAGGSYEVVQSDGYMVQSEIRGICGAGLASTIRYQEWTS